VVNPRAYYAYDHLLSSAWAYDTQDTYFKQTLYGDYYINDNFAKIDSQDFMSGTEYNILLGTGNKLFGSLLLRANGGNLDNVNGWTTLGMEGS
jgi:hypothetical protein